MPASFHIARDGAIQAAQLPEQDRAAIEWQQHLDAGRFIAAAPRAAAPEIAANRARTEAIVRAHAAAQHAK